MKNVWIHTARWSLVLLLGLICTVPVSGKEGSDSITVKRFFCERDSLLNCTIVCYPSKRVSGERSISLYAHARENKAHAYG